MFLRNTTSQCITKKGRTTNYITGKEWTVHGPLFFRKIVEIERFVLRVAILHECQNYLGGEGGLGGSEIYFSRPPFPLQL